MKYQRTDQGSLFAIVVIVLLISLISFLGFIFWMKFVDVNDHPISVQVGSFQDKPDSYTD